MNHRLDSRRIATAGLAALATLLIVACGGSDDESSGSTTMSIAAAGATLDGPGGSQLVVPAGALNQATSVTVAQGGGGAPTLPPGATDIGAMFALTPHGTAFAVPATIRVPFDPSRLGAGEVPTLWKTNAAQTGWEQIPGATVSGNFVEAQITSFSWVVVRTPLLPPLIGVQPAPQSVTEPATATFAVGASSLVNSGPLAYQWRRNGAVITGATGPTYTTGPTTVAADHGALYSVDVSNSVGTSASGTAALIVTNAPVTSATLIVTVSPANAGTVTSAPTGIDCGADCSETYALNTAVTLNAAPAPGFTFSAWSANCPAGAVTMSTGTACTATFVATPPPLPPSALGRISAGGRFSLAVDAAGVPHSWGNDSASQLGNGLPDANRSTAAPFGTITGVRSVSAGQEYHGIAVLGDGTAWAWGYRGNVDCAVGSVASVPFKVDYATDVLAASAGYDHTLLLRADGRVLSFGCNHAGQLGRPGAAPPMTPLAIVPGLAANIVAVAAGDAYSLALDANGDVWSWGRVNPADRSAAGFSPTPVRVAGLSNVVAIAAAKEHALALRRDGAVLAWGSNRNGKLGDGTEVDRIAATPTLLVAQITAIAAGGESSLALRSDGTVLSWGINETGQLGSGSASPGYRPTPAAVVGLANIVAISCGAGALGHSLALDRNGAVWAWGHNNAGQLGDGTTTARLAPVAVTGLNLN